MNNISEALYRLKKIKDLHFQGSVLVNCVFNELKEDMINSIYLSGMPPIASKNKNIEEIKEVWKENEKYLEKLRVSKNFSELLRIEINRNEYLNNNFPLLDINIQQKKDEFNYLLENKANKINAFFNKNKDNLKISRRVLNIYENIKQTFLNKYNYENMEIFSEKRGYIPDDKILNSAKNMINKFGFNSYNISVDKFAINAPNYILKKIHVTEDVLNLSAKRFNLSNKDLGLDGVLNYHDKINISTLTRIDFGSEESILGVQSETNIGLQHENVKQEIKRKIKANNYSSSFIEDMSTVYMHEYTHTIDYIIGKRVKKENNNEHYILFSQIYKGFREKNYPEINELFRDLLYYSYNNGKKDNIEDAKIKIKKKNDHMTNIFLSKILNFDSYMKIKKDILKYSEDFIHFIYELKNNNIEEYKNNNTEYIKRCIDNKLFNGIINDIFKASGKDNNITDKIINVISDNNHILEKYKMQIDVSFDNYYSNLNITSTNDLKNKHPLYFKYISSPHERVANALRVKKNEEVIHKILKKLVSETYNSIDIINNLEKLPKLGAKDQFKNKIKKILNDINITPERKSAPVNKMK